MNHICERTVEPGVDAYVDYFLCDYCGKQIDALKSDLSGIPAFEIMESAYAEESWYFYELPSSLENRDQVDVHKIFTEHTLYRYCTDLDKGTSCCYRMIEEAVTYANTKRREEFRRGNYLFAIMEEARLVMVSAKLAEGMTPWELGINKDQETNHE